MPARRAIDPGCDRDGVTSDQPTADDRPLDDCLHDLGVEVARRELSTALAGIDDLTPAQRRTVALMAGRIAAGVLAPARDAMDDDSRSPEAVERLFTTQPEQVRERR
ncbi:hypothetical protein [Haloplanus salilacus]|uniref:hypothetical protein n=1 Tax=Haloplanus salilacus TaxID=2949994 RepID=UPI0030D259BB